MSLLLYQQAPSKVTLSCCCKGGKTEALWRVAKGHWTASNEELERNKLFPPIRTPHRARPQLRHTAPSGKERCGRQWAQLISGFWILVLGAGSRHCGPRSFGFCKGSQKSLDFYMLVQVLKANQINKPPVGPLNMGGKGLASSLGGDLGFGC